MQYVLKMLLQAGVYTYPVGTDGLKALSPKPKKLAHQYDTLIAPVQKSLWMLLLAFLLLITVSMYVISISEEIIKTTRLRHWSHFGQASWYAFSTLIGESVTRVSKSDGAWALR